MCPVVAQSYETDADKEYVILGNSAIVKCDIPSFVADFVSVTSWLEEKAGVTYYHSRKHFGTPVSGVSFSCPCFQLRMK